MQKFNKAINTDSIRPSTKPILTHKSDNFDYKRQTLMPNRSEKRNYHAIDSIKQRQSTAINRTGFHQSHLYNQNQDLASSFSFSQEDDKHQEEKLLFSKFIRSKNLHHLSLIRDMNKINKQKLVNFVKIGQDEKSIYLNRIISHYIGIWLESMGYKQVETKKKIIMNLQLIFEDEQDISQIGQALYDSLFHGYLPQDFQLKLLIQVCKKGWEYLSFFIAKFIKILKRFKKISEKEFIAQVEKCI